MRTDSFVLEGVTYYAEMRKCSKPGCRCADGERLHGPYWYSRDREGRVAYVGKEIPLNVFAAREVLQACAGDIVRRQKAIVREISELQAIANALHRLVNCWSLSKADRAIILEEGFATCLVSPGADRATQEQES